MNTKQRDEVVAALRVLIGLVLGLKDFAAKQSEQISGLTTEIASLQSRLLEAMADDQADTEALAAQSNANAELSAKLAAVAAELNKTQQELLDQSGWEEDPQISKLLSFAEKLARDLSSEVVSPVAEVIAASEPVLPELPVAEPVLPTLEAVTEVAPPEEVAIATEEIVLEPSTPYMAADEELAAVLAEAESVIANEEPAE